MYVVTGGAGFIGANIVKRLNERGIRDILVVDNLEKADKFKKSDRLRDRGLSRQARFHRLVAAKRSPQVQGGLS